MLQPSPCRPGLPAPPDERPSPLAAAPGRYKRNRLENKSIRPEIIFCLNLHWRKLEPEVELSGNVYGWLYG